MTLANKFFNKLEGTWQNKLNGDWQDNLGWSVISQPKINNPATDDFNIRVDQMRETITFKKIGSARNIGVTGEAGFWQSLAYEVSIETPEGEGIHHEMGHFLMSIKEDGNTFENFTAAIIRQATIPRANSFMTHGHLLIGSITHAIAAQNGDAFYSARTVVNNQTLQDKIDTELLVAQQDVTGKNGPNLMKPLEWLADTLANNVVGTDWVFSFRNDMQPSQMASGQRVESPVTIGNLLSDFWIGHRSIDNDEKEILQYIQKVDLGFNGVDWPHVAVNTLIKQ